NGAIYHWNKTMIEGLDALDPAVRVLDQSRIGAVLTGDAGALKGGPPVDALFIQNTNPMMVAPDLNVVHRGFARDDLFVCVHEQFMTETAKVADVVLPATMFTEHDDLYQGGGHQHIMLGPKVVDAPEGCRSNHEVICALAKRLGAKHPGFDMSVRELIDWTLVNSGWRGIADLEREKWFDVQPAFEAAHYLKGFAWPDGKFRFKADWAGVKPQGFGPANGLPALPDHNEVIEESTAEMPFRLATSPARNFLNSSFTETRSSVKREGRPTVLVHPSDAARAGVTDGARVRLGNTRGTVLVHARLFDGLREGVLVVEGIWPNAAFEEGIGINALTGADPIGPVGGAAFHDNRVWLKPA
ncbi:MAG: molybdopterin oxidoreductase family protein, partial [Betaproteobacteria bacterium]|nr:molybdopterin oxidoreductase family protein [Betaproteobacteria bacterium]